MKYRDFGRLGWGVSEIGIGAWAIGGGWGEQSDADSVSALLKGLELGVNFIDTAQGYGNGRSEEVIGQALQELQSKSKIYIATKIPPIPGYWPPLAHENCEDRYPEKYLRESVETSLKRLKVDCIDLLQLHTWTRAWNKDPQPLQVLSQLKQEGKIKGIGLSTPEQDQNAFNDLMRAGLLDSIQVIYNIFDQEAASELLDIAYENGVGVIVRCVLDEGSLTGKFNEQTQFGKGDWRKNFFRGDRLKEVLKRVDKIQKEIEESPEEGDLTSVAIRFALNHPSVSTVITGVRNEKQIIKNTSVTKEPPLPVELYHSLQKQAWRRYFWS